MGKCEVWMWKSKCIFAAGADSREELAAVAVVCPTYMSEEGSVSSRGAEGWDFLEHIAIISLLSDSRAEVLQLNQHIPGPGKLRALWVKWNLSFVELQCLEERSRRVSDTLFALIPQLRRVFLFSSNVSVSGGESEEWWGRSRKQKGISTLP